MAEKENHVGSEIEKPNNKAPYRSPKLVIYGDIREITLNTQKAGSADNKGKDMNMTQ